MKVEDTQKKDVLDVRSPRITDVAVQLYKSILHKHAGHEGEERQGVGLVGLVATELPVP